MEKKIEIVGGNDMYEKRDRIVAVIGSENEEAVYIVTRNPKNKKQKLLKLTVK